METTTTNIHDLVKLSEAYLERGEGEIASMYARLLSEEVAHKSGKGEKPPHQKEGLYDFHFNWKDGGYNNVTAGSRKEALEEVKKKFGEHWIVNEGTLRVLTGLEARAHWKLNFFD